MENAIGFMGLGFLILVQLAGFAFFFGKLTQSVKDWIEVVRGLCTRVDKLEETTGVKNEKQQALDKDFGERILTLEIKGPKGLVVDIPNDKLKTK